MKLENLFEAEEASESIEPAVIAAVRELIKKTNVPVSITSSKSRNGTAYKINRLKSRRDEDEIMTQEDRFPMFVKLLRKTIEKHVKDGDKINVERPSRYFSDAQEAKKAGTNTDADLDTAFGELQHQKPEDPSSFPRIFVLRQEAEDMECTFDLTFNTTHVDSKTPARFAKHGTGAETASIVTAYSFKVPEEVGKRFVRLARGYGKTFYVEEPDPTKFKKLLELLNAAGAKFRTYSYGPREYDDFKDRRVVNVTWALTPYKKLKRATEIDDPQIFILTSEFAEKQDKKPL